MADLKSRVEHYREKAAEAERNARLAKDPAARAAYWEAAASWTDMAEQAERMAKNAD